MASEAVTIPGLNQPVLLVPGVLYRYDVDKATCPACGGVGFPWGGRFSCRCCPAIAVVSSGETFLPYKERDDDQR